jgi:hypothetical protein
LTQPGMFHYSWSLSETYRLCVEAIDRYGNPSEAKPIVYHFTPSKQPNLWDRVVSAWPVIVGVLTTHYALAFVMLLLLTKRYAWAFRVISDAVWAKWLTWPFFLLRNVHATAVGVGPLVRAATTAEFQATGRCRVHRSTCIVGCGLAVRRHDVTRTVA